MTPQEAFNELSYYTLSHKTDEFTHQYIVDTFAVQNADENTKPIAINFGLIGLYLHVEKGFTGKQVQHAHMQLAKYKDKLPHIVLPNERGELTVFDVLQASEGEERDESIQKWMRSVWGVYADSHGVIERFLQKYLL